MWSLTHANWISGRSRWNRYSLLYNTSKWQRRATHEEMACKSVTDISVGVKTYIETCLGLFSSVSMLSTQNTGLKTDTKTTWEGRFCGILSLITCSIHSKIGFQWQCQTCERQTPVRPCDQHISLGSSNIAIRSYHKMDFASLSGAVYGVGSASTLCMGLFWAGLSLSLDSICHSLAAVHCSVQCYRQAPTTQRPPLSHGNR